MSKATELRLKSFNALEADTKKHVDAIVAECDALTIYGKFDHRVSTSKMLSVNGVVKTLEAMEFRVDKVENKDQRGEVEGYSLVLHW